MSREFEHNIDATDPLELLEALLERECAISSSGLYCGWCRSEGVHHCEKHVWYQTERDAVKRKVQSLLKGEL